MNGRILSVAFSFSTLILALLLRLFPVSVEMNQEVIPTNYATVQWTIEMPGSRESIPFSAMPIVYLYPFGVLKMEIGSTFYVNVVVANVTNLYDWELKLYYENLVLNATEVVEGPFLAAGGVTHYEVIQLDTYNATHGFVWVRCALVGVSNGVDGSGVLATIILKFTGVGESVFTFSDTKLGDPGTHPITHTRFGGTLVLLSSSPVSPLKIFNIPWEENFYKVTTYSNSTIAKLNFNQSLNQISFYVNGISYTTGFCNITIPKTLLRENSTNPWVIFMDGSEIAYIKSENETHTSLYFNYTHSTHRIQIIGAEVIPEFPSIIVMSLMMILTTLAVVFAKKISLRKLKNYYIENIQSR